MAGERGPLPCKEAPFLSRRVSEKNPLLNISTVLHGFQSLFMNIIQFNLHDNFVKRPRRVGLFVCLPEGHRIRNRNLDLVLGLLSFPPFHVAIRGECQPLRLQDIETGNLGEGQRTKKL